MKKKLSFVIGILFASWMIYWLVGRYFEQPVFIKEITSVECEPPCWRGIYPGKTTGNEAYDLISRFADNITGTVKAGPYNIFDAYYIFDLSNGLRVAVWTIRDVVVKITFYRDEGVITFGDAIKLFGAPQYATQSIVLGPGLPILPSSSWHTYFNVLNVERGVAWSFDTYRHLFPIKAVGESTVITDVTYFDPEQIETLLKDGSLVDSDEVYLYMLNPWIGYGNLSELYP